MNPDLEALVKAYDALTGCAKERAADARRGFQALLTDTLAKHPQLERERFVARRSSCPSALGARRR